MRFIHTADLHIGARPDAGRPWAQARADAIRHSLERFVDLCNQEAVDLLLIAGDLFHAPPTEAQLKEADYQFKRLAATQVVLIAGNHDYLRPGSAYSEHAFPPHVHLIRSATPESIHFPAWRLDVTGFSYYGEIRRDNPLAGYIPPQNGLRHFLLLHGGDADHVPFNPSDFQAAGWDYIALGHIHKPSLNQAGKAAMPGSPEPLDRTESGSHGYYLGKLEGQSLSLDWRPFSRFSYTELKINVTPDTTLGALENLLKKRMKTDGSEVYRLRLTGRRDPDTPLEAQELLRLGPVSDVLDETRPDYPWEELKERPRQDMVRRVMDLLAPAEEDPEAPVKEKALYYALDALLGSEKKKREVLR